MIFAFAALRALHLASLMLLFGSAVLLLRLRAQVPELGIESSALRRLRLCCAVIAPISALAWFSLASGQMAGSTAAMTDPVILRLTLTGTLFGQVFIARILVLAALCGVTLAGWDRLTALLAGAGLVLVSATSHAAAASPAHFTAIGITNDGLHLLCGGIWLGGLCVLAAVMAQRRAAPRLPAALALFAQWGMVAVALLVMTGLINATTIVLGTPGHASRLYLGVLGAKLVLVLAMLALALSNQFRLMPRLSRPDAAVTLKGNIAWELGLGLGVVLLAGLLGLLQPTL